MFIRSFAANIQDLIEEKDFGAFKEVIDHGLTLRKAGKRQGKDLNTMAGPFTNWCRSAAFQALQTVLEVAPYKLKPLSTFISQIQKGSS